MDRRDTLMAGAMALIALLTGLAAAEPLQPVPFTDVTVNDAPPPVTSLEELAMSLPSLAEAIRTVRGDGEVHVSQ